MKIKVYLTKYLPIIIFIGLSLLVVWLTPVLAEKPQKNVKYEAGFYYTVKKGDTLWDISQHFDDSPWVWPELWKENEQLPNPHWIYPGERIRLFRKSDQHRYQEQIKKGPTKAPQAEPDHGAQVNFYYGRMDRVGFIRKPAVQPLGFIFNVLDDKKLVSAGDVVYLRSPENGPKTEFAPGSRFTVYRELTPTDDRHSDKKIGTQHYLLGVVEVTQNEPEYAIAKVIEGFHAIHAGDLIMEYKTRTPDIILTDSTLEIEGRIIGSEDHNKLIGSNLTAFIDKGEVDNIRMGQQYTIYYQETKKGADGKTIELAPVDIGALIVLHTEKTTATVFITEAQGEIVPGTKFRTP